MKNELWRGITSPTAMLWTWDHDGWKENEKPVKITSSVIFLSRIGGSGGGGKEFPIVKRDLRSEICRETTKLAKSRLAPEPTLSSHRSTHRNARDTGPPANERARQTVSSIRRWNFFTGFLVTLVQGEVCFPGDLQGICGQKPRNY